MRVSLRASIPLSAALLLACVGDSPTSTVDAGPLDSGLPDTVVADSGTQDSPGCSTGLDLCGGKCVDLTASAPHCGACGHDCGSDATCVDSRCTAATIASVEHPVGVAASGPAVFWLRGDRSTFVGALETCTAVGCNPTKIAVVNSDFDIIVPASEPTGATLLTDGTYLQWFAQNSSQNTNVHPFHCPIVGCDHISKGVAENPDSVIAMAIGGPSGSLKLLYRVPVGAARTCPFGICSNVNQTSIPLPSDQNPSAIAADATRLYFDDPFKSQVNSCVLGTTCTGSGSTPLFSPGASILAVGGTTLVASGGGTLRSCPVTGCGGQPTTLATNQPNVTAMVADANAVYFALGGTLGTANGEIRTCPLPDCKGGAKSIATGLAFPNSLAISGGALFWSNGGTTGVSAVKGSIQRITL